MDGWNAVGSGSPCPRALFPMTTMLVLIKTERDEASVQVHYTHTIVEIHSTGEWEGRKRDLSLSAKSSGEY